LYPYFYLCKINFLIVITTNDKKYPSKKGQNTGKSNNLEQVNIKLAMPANVKLYLPNQNLIIYQYLNSDILRINGFEDSS
jgi:hypothetical protein